jgi:hypothetical protein
MIPHWFVALCVLGACSQGATPAQDGAVTGPASSSVAQPSDDTGGSNVSRNPCDVITAADVAGIVVAPVTRASSESAPALCIYQSRTHAKVTIGEAQGDAAKGAWTLATTYNATNTPVAGVGDEALRDVTGTTLIARRGDQSCRVDVLGYDNSDAMDDITKDRGETLARKLGALCNKIFVSH